MVIRRAANDGWENDQGLRVVAPENVPRTKLLADQARAARVRATSCGCEWRGAAAGVCLRFEGHGELCGSVCSHAHECILRSRLEGWAGPRFDLLRLFSVAGAYRTEALLRLACDCVLCVVYHSHTHAHAPCLHVCELCVFRVETQSP